MRRLRSSRKQPTRAVPNASGQFRQSTFFARCRTKGFTPSERVRRRPLIRPDQLLHPRRADDQRPDLWTTFNVVQENALKGGLVGIGWDAQGRPHRSRTREVRGIDQDVRLNKALWTLSEHMAKIVRSAA